MSIRTQKCSSCRAQFSEDAPERNYKLYANYGFHNEEKFRTHSSRNSLCPCKNAHVITKIATTYPDEIIVEEHEIAELSVSEVEWGPYVSRIQMSEEDYADNQEIIKIKYKIHCRKGRPLWFPNSEEASCNILSELLNPETQFITLVAEPGTGKTAVIHNLVYRVSLLPYEKAINANCITITTGMSDTDWYSQLIDNFKLKDNYLWSALDRREDTHCVSHRSNFHKRITWLLNHLEHLSNHLFIVDENHIADEIEMTIDNEFKRLGLTEYKMKEYNIKIVNISATPDVSLSLMSRKDNHKMVILPSGHGYKGFEYYSNCGMLIDYTDIDLESIIRKRYSTPRYHYIRARTQQEKGSYRNSIIDICKNNEWDFIEDDSSFNYYLSFYEDALENKLNKTIIHTYLAPTKHTIILIKNKYPASKRLKITRYTGVVMEKPADKMNTTVTCNGLIPRFWGYEELPAFPHNQKPLFVCNKKSVDEYVKFKHDFVYNGKSYTSIRIKSDEFKLKEYGTTWCANIASVKPTSKIDNSKFRVYKDKNDMDYVVKTICGKNYGFQDPIDNFIYTSLNGPAKIASLSEAINKVNSGYTGQKDSNSGGRTVYPCYLDVTDYKTELFVVLIGNLGASEEQMQKISEYGKNIEIETEDSIQNLKQHIWPI